MRNLAHLSSLMIGWTSSDVLTALSESLACLQPDVVAVSGNLTMGGTATELRHAREFLDGLPSPQVVVPGDSDYSPYARMSNLLTASNGFAKCVEANPTPCFADREIVVIGTNSARGSSDRKAMLSEEQGRVNSILEKAEPGALRILVSFRPTFLGDRFEPREDDGRVFRSVFDLQLEGPLDSRKAQGFRPSDTTLFVSCGSRPEGLGFNLLRVRTPEIVVEQYGWKHEVADFRLLGSETLHLARAEWTG